MRRTSQYLSLGISLLLAAISFGQSARPIENEQSSQHADVQEAHFAATHSVHEANDGYRAHNPGQDWWSTFSPLGLLIQPNEAKWSWGLELEAYGFKGMMMSPEGPALSSHGNRVTREWDSNLSEWYINDQRGLEHGFTIHRRPQAQKGCSSPLLFELAILGTLKPNASSHGKAVQFQSPQGNTLLRYEGLHVFDSKGITQPATFTLDGQSLLISVQEGSADYPLTIDPIAQQSYLKAHNTDTDDRFATSVAISGDLAVVGSPWECSDAVGVNGDPNNNSRFWSGAAYVYRRTGGTWIQEAYLKASNPGASDQFGSAVSISGSTIAIGAFGESSNASGIDGDQGNNILSRAGAVYAFNLAGGVWTQQAYVKASNPDLGDFFGLAVSISGDLLIVGANGEDSITRGVNGDPFNNGALESGAAYIFERTAGTWSQVAYLKASNSESHDIFGASVSISGHRAIVGSGQEDSASAGVNGIQFNNFLRDAGAAYIFERSAGVWQRTAYLKASNPGYSDSFGWDVSIAQDLAIVAARDESNSATGINGNQHNGISSSSGAVYVFQQAAGIWTQLAYVKASNTGSYDRFGWSTAASGNSFVVGTWEERSSSGGVHSNENDNTAIDAGAAYLFSLSNGTVVQEAYIKASNAEPGDAFGSAVAISEDHFLVGAPMEGSDSIGTDGNQFNNNAPRSGAAYMFDTSVTTSNHCGAAVPNSSGSSAAISMSGSLAVSDNSFSLHASGLPANQIGYFLSSPGHDFVAHPGGSDGNLCIGGGAVIGRHLDSTQNFGPSGTLDFTLNLNNIPSALGPVTKQPGETWYFQCWFRDTNPGFTSNFTNGLSVQFQ